MCACIKNREFQLNQPPCGRHVPPHLLPTPLQRHFLSGGPQRMRHTLLPLAFCALETVREVAAAEKAGNAPKVGGMAASASALSAPSCTLPPINHGMPVEACQARAAES